MTAQLLRFCQKLAAEGYAVLARDLSDDFHEESVNDAWPRLLDFFHGHLAAAQPLASE